MAYKRRGPFRRYRRRRFRMSRLRRIDFHPQVVKLKCSQANANTTTTVQVQVPSALLGSTRLGLEVLQVHWWLNTTGTLTQGGSMTAMLLVRDPGGATVNVEDNTVFACMGILEHGAISGPRVFPVIQDLHDGAGTGRLIVVPALYLQIKSSNFAADLLHEVVAWLTYRWTPISATELAQVTQSTLM